MKRTLITLFTICVLTVLTVMAQNLAGDYAITSASNPGGSAPYKGAVRLEDQGKGIYNIKWAIAGQQAFQGVGLLYGDVLGIGWGVGGQYGVIIYQINGSSLAGRWTTPDMKGTFAQEELQGPAGLNGAYKIVSSRNPQGGQYSGTVTIKPTGQTYAVQWSLASGEKYRGVGIRTTASDGKEILIVGWGYTDNVGVVSYRVQGNSLKGTWALLGGSQLGSEAINRR